MTAKVVSPGHEEYFKAETVEECVAWIENFANETNNYVIETGPGTYKVGDFNLYIFETEDEAFPDADYASKYAYACGYHD